MRQKTVIGFNMILFVFALLLFQPSHAGSQLTVAGTTPPDRAVGVDPDLGEIIVMFSGPVKMNSWSFVRTDKGELPKIVGEPFFPDNRTCVLPVTLEQGVTYGIGINSRTRMGFKSARDERVAVTPYVLIFTTAEHGSAKRPPRGIQGSAGPMQTASRVEPSEASSSRKGENAIKTVVFRRMSEPRENAFSLLAPRGWVTEGGIFRVNPASQGGAAQSIAAKLDFALKNNPRGDLMIRWLPDMLYYDARMSPAGQMGLFPPGSNYNGMTVCPLMTARDFITRMAFPYVHQQASNVKILEQRNLDGLAARYLQGVRSYIPQATFSYDAALLTASYREGGVEYKEKMLCVIENWGQMGAGMWGNKQTFYLRAPLNEFDKWQPVFSVIQESVSINSRWLQGEIRGQMQRSKIMMDVMRDIQRIDREIGEHQRRTNAEIHNDMFLTLTDQEEYVNPYTNKIEVGSNQWRHRWVNESGDVIYTDDENYDPRVDVNLNRSDYKKTPVRKRFPQ